MNAPRKALTVILTMGLITYAGACETLGLSSPPLTASLRTDSAEIGVHMSGFTYLGKIGFVYVNTTSGPVSKAGCGFPPFPDLQKKVDGKWVAAYSPVYLACLTKPDFVLRSGESYHGVLEFMAAQPGHQTEPSLLVDSIDGVYRLQWDFAQGTDTGIKGARTVQAISNEFRMVQSPR
jgi:hypothetical protein